MNKIFIIVIILLLYVSLNISGQNKTALSDLKSELKALGLKVSDQEKKAPDFTVKDSSGKELKLSDTTGKIIFLNFWASWCPPCKAEMPSIQKLYETIKNKNFMIIALDVGEPKEDGIAFIKKSKYTFPVMFEKNNEASIKYSVDSIPATYIIDKSGNFIAVQIGSYEWDNPKLIKIIEKLLQ